MQLNELCVGDWVKQKGSLLVFQVSAIRDGYVEGKKDDGEFAIDSIDPIPLTNGILKANGFEYETTYSQRKLIRKNLWVKVVIFEKSHCILNYNCGTYVVPFKYVHELQRALRILGLHQLANDFVICKQKIFK